MGNFSQNSLSLSAPTATPRRSSLGLADEYEMAALTPVSSIKRTGLECPEHTERPQLHEETPAPSTAISLSTLGSERHTSNVNINGFQQSKSYGPKQRVSEMNGRIKAPTARSFWWWEEISATILSFVCISLIVAILAKVNNQPTSIWNLYFTPNGIISVCTTVGKMALMIPVVSCISQLKWSHFIRSSRPLDHMQRFDDASRGPLGAFRLLTFSISREAHLVTAWGLALVTVAGLAMEPTAQNVLEQVSRESLMTDVKSRIGIATAYTSRAYPIENLFTQLWGFAILKDLENTYFPSKELIQFQSSTYDAVVNGATSPQFSCESPASRCTWPSFTTLGVCSSYENITEQVTMDCWPVHAQGKTICEYKPHKRIVPEEKDPKPIRMVFGKKPTLEDMKGPISGKQGLTTHCSSTGGSTGILQSCIVVRARLVLEAVKLRMSAQAQTEFDMEHPTPLPTETLKINWYWCSQTFTNVSVGGGVQDKVHGDVYTEGLIIPNATITNGDRVTSKNNQTLYNISVPAQEGLWMQLRMFDKLEFFSLYATPPNSTRTDLAYQLLAADDVGELAGRVADSLTTRIRDVEGPTSDNLNATWVEGDAFKMEQYFDVRWPWLILPLLETVLAGLLLAATMYVTRGEPLLKTSVLAFLLHPLAGWTEDEMRPAQLHHESMKALARTMSGQLAYDGMGSAVFMKTA